jgi:hypothetical protein
MRFRVIWLRRAIEGLAHAYTLASADDRALAVTTEMAQADQVLGVNPQHVGESREGNERIYFLQSLVLQYEWFEEEKVVVVFNAGYRP